jgi:hypothetical protein
MEFKTKAQAQLAIDGHESRAKKCDEMAAWQRVAHKREHEENAARYHRRKAEEIRALLPSLPEPT